MKVVRVDQSPMNPQRWCLTLSCGHEVWITSRGRPKRARHPCQYEKPAPQFTGRTAAIELNSQQSVDLEVPPSTNNLFINTRRGRAKSTDYKAWIARNEVVAWALKPIKSGEFTIVYTLVGGSDINRGRDLGNVEKPLTDLLVSTKRIPGDSLHGGLIGIELRYVHAGEGASYVKVEIAEAA